MGCAGKGGLTAAEEARCLNVIGDYVAQRDVPALTRAALAEAGVSGGVADVAVLFGGSIVAGGDTFAEAMRAGVARTYVIVGGAGHTTATLRERMRELRPGALCRRRPRGGHLLGLSSRATRPGGRPSRAALDELRQQRDDAV